MTWYLPSERYDEIRSIVADLIEDWGITFYPFSIWELTRRIGIRTFRYSEAPTILHLQIALYWPDAITVYPDDFNPNKTLIFYNDNQSRNHTRFTIAHELAHLVLMHPDTGEKIYEHEANIFANYLLAPAPLVLRDSKLDVETIRNDFQISYSCACSVKDRAEKRRVYGSGRYTEYEQRILTFCSLKGGDSLACS